MKNKRAVIAKVLSLLLIVSLLFPGAVSARAKEGYDITASRFITNNKPKKVFSEIVMKIGESSMLVSGEKTDTLPAKVMNGEIYVCAPKVAAAAEMPYVSTFSQGGYARLDTLAENLNLSVSVDDENITITAPYQLCQLILEVKAGTKPSDMLDAKDFITDGISEFIICYDSPAAAKAALESFETDPNVISCTPNKVIRSSVKVDPDDIAIISTSEIWGNERVSSAMMKDKVKDKAKITVAVVDSGIDDAHELFKNRLVAGANFSSSGGSKPFDDLGHGTHVAGTVVLNTPSNVQIMPVKCLDSEGNGSDYQCKQAVDFAVKNGAKVINLSLGGDCTDPNCAFRKSVKEAISKGVTVVAAAGNKTQNVSAVCPANVAEVITVSASDEWDDFASFSNYGGGIDICGPGVDIYSAEVGGGYCWMNGTSMASPHISAGAVMIRMNEPSLTPAQVETKIRNSGQDAGAVGKDNYFGYGILNLAYYLGVQVYPHTLYMSDSYINVLFSPPGYEYHPILFYMGPLNITNRSLDITTSNSSVARYNSGFVEIVGFGDAKLTATAAGGRTVNCLVSAFNSDKKTKLHSLDFPIDRESGIIHSVPIWFPIKYLLESFTSYPEYVEIYKDDWKLSFYNAFVGSGMEIRLVVDGATIDKVKVAVMGDLDGDGYCDVSDIVAIRNVVMTGMPSKFTKYCADLDMDDKIDVSDVVAMRNMIMGT